MLSMVHDGVLSIGIYISCCECFHPLLSEYHAHVVVTAITRCFQSIMLMLL
jgi:hypothetical protein